MKELLERIWLMPAEDLRVGLEMLLLKVIWYLGVSAVIILIIGLISYIVWETRSSIRGRWNKYRSLRLLRKEVKQAKRLPLER